MSTDAGAPHDPNHRKVSALLARLAREFTGKRISLRDILQAMGDRAFGVLMLILALPNAIGIGTIPGLSTVTGVPQIFVAIQMILGLSRPWFPAWGLDRSLAAADFRTMVERSVPYLEKGERLLQPRWPGLVSPLAERVIGVVCLILACVQALPIPFGNQPPAVAVALLSLGIIERDGLFVVIGFAAAMVATAIALTVAGAISAGVVYFFYQVLSWLS
jgi:hypothetical protein